ncbi:MAG: DUF4386 family protein [Eubacteriales bacterium]
MKESNKLSLQKAGGISMIYAGLAYLAMIVYFLGIIDYTSITDAGEKIQLFSQNQAGFYVIYLLGYVIFGLALVVISLSLYEKLKQSSSITKIAAVYGIIWAALLIGAGTIYNRGIATAVQMYASDPAGAIAFLNATEATALGISFSDGEILGGLWTLLISIAAMKGKIFNKAINYLGLVVGTAGILSVIPAINEFGGTGIFGIGQMIWFVWVGILMLKEKQA